MMKAKTRTVRIVTLGLLVVAGFGLVSTAEMAQAAMLTISEDFQDSTSWEATKTAGDWSVWWYGAANSSSVVAWPASDPGDPANGLKVGRDSGTGSAVQMVYAKEGYTSEGGYNDTGTCDDVEGSVILRGSGSPMNAMALVRCTKTSMYTNDPALGYVIGLKIDSGTSSSLVIAKNPVNHTNVGTELATLNITGDWRGKTLKLDFSAVGTTLTGSLYAWDDEDEDFIDLLGAVSVEDDTHTQGHVGLRMGAGWYYSANFADFNVDVVPEPATILLLAGGSLGVALRRRSR